MSQLKDFQAGTAGDSFNGPHNGTVGATTPASGAFTTLSTTGNTTLGNDSGDVIQVNGASTFTNVNPILSAGTANGVAYLNGSKVLTTGSALTFDGTNLKNSQSTASPIGLRLNNDSTSTSAGARLTFQYNSGDTGYVGNQFDGTDFNNQYAANRFHIWLNNGSEQMRLTSTGLGIGTSSPSARLQAAIASDGGDAIRADANSSNGLMILRPDGANGNQLRYGGNGANANILRFVQGGDIERARIDSSGNLLVGATSVIDAGKFSVLFDNSSANGISIKMSSTTYNNNLLSFRNSSDTQVGYIYSNGTTTTYATSSDYRLKNTIAPMTGALAKVALLKPCTYKWNADGSDGEGFIAHELAEVVPQCVTGEKDAVDADGKPQYQGIDTSFLVATLTAALQELNAKFDAYVATHP
jgi:hypothetical protein